MEDLEMIVKKMINEKSPSSSVQAHQLEMAEKIVDELMDRGLVEAPSYRLAPTHTMPSRSVLAVL